VARVGDGIGLRPEGGFRDVADIIRSQQRFIGPCRPDATFSTFSDAHFDEATFEAQLTADRLASCLLLLDVN